MNIMGFKIELVSSGLLLATTEEFVKKSLIQARRLILVQTRQGRSGDWIRPKMIKLNLLCF